MNQILSQLRDVAVIAVLRSPSARDAIDVASTLAEAGVGALEITMTTPGAAAVIAELTAGLTPDTVVGAGTILTESDADAARSAGAHFLVSPGLPVNPHLIAACESVPLIPGVLSPTELMVALHHGAEAVKVFPASSVGPDHLRGLRGPFPKVPMIPTGGINAHNVASWIEAGAMAVGVGGSLCPQRLGSDAERVALRRRAQTLISTVMAARAAATHGGVR